jgi:sulfur carrier protein
MITITINGEARHFEQPLQVRELVDKLGLAGKRIAVERNGEIVPRSEFGASAISDGDKLEIVVAVGGG